MTTYETTIAADSPVAWYKLDETTGTNAEDDGSGTDADGTYTGGYTLAEAGIDGSRPSVKLGGASGYVSIGALPAKLQFAGNFSVEAWVCFDASLATPGAAVVTEAYAGDSNVRYMLGFYDGSSSTRKPTFGWYNGSWRLAISPDELDDGNWHHLVGTWDGTVLELFVDGVSVATQSTVGTPPTGTEALYLGRRWDSGANQYFDGWVDEVALYGSELSATQVADHYAARDIGAANMRLTHAVLEPIATDASPLLGLTHVVVEPIAKDATALLALTHIVVEAVVPFDIAYWDDLYAMHSALEEAPEGYVYTGQAYRSHHLYRQPKVYRG